MRKRDEKKDDDKDVKDDDTDGLIVVSRERERESVLCDGFIQRRKAVVLIKA